MLKRKIVEYALSALLLGRFICYNIRMQIRRLLVHAHFFYAPLASEIAACTRNFIDVCGAEAVEVVATYPETKPEFAALLAGLLPQTGVKIVAVPNRGYDIGPFVCEVLNRYPLDSYDCLVKLHTKRDVDGWVNFRPVRGGEWRRVLLRFCATPAKVRASLAAFARHPSLGMIAASRFINYAAGDFCPSTRRDCRDLLRKLGLRPTAPVSVAGTIFMVRAALFKPLANRFTWTDFPEITPSNAHIDFNLVGSLELAFATLVAAQGYVVAEGVLPPGVALLGYRLFGALSRLVRFGSRTARRLVGDRALTACLGRIMRG